MDQPHRGGNGGRGGRGGNGGRGGRGKKNGGGSSQSGSSSPHTTSSAGSTPPHTASDTSLEQTSTSVQQLSLQPATGDTSVPAGLQDLPQPALPIQEGKPAPTYLYIVCRALVDREKEDCDSDLS